MNDCISRKAAIEAINHICPVDTEFDCALLDREDVRYVLSDLPSAQPTLYGYQIEHLAYIAKVMEKEGVTAEYATKTFEDISRAVRMIIEEAQQKVEEMLNECRPPRPYKEEE